MATKAICIAGLPGSGKTYLAHKMKEQDSSLVMFDDPRDAMLIMDALLSGQSCIIADAALCEPFTRELLEGLLGDCSEIEWHCFENNPEQCRVNVRDRDDEREVEGSILRYAKSYTYPTDATIIPVWSTAQ